MQRNACQVPLCRLWVRNHIPYPYIIIYSQCQKIVQVVCDLRSGRLVVENREPDFFFAQRELLLLPCESSAAEDMIFRDRPAVLLARGSHVFLLVIS